MMAALAVLGVLASPLRAAPGAWRALWLPDAESVRFSAPAELDGTSYATLSTRHFKLHYPARRVNEHDRRLPLHVAARLDGLYDFLADRTGARPAAPIEAVLIGGQYGRARTEPERNRIETGEEGELPFVLGSLFHELVHLFNFAKPGASQDFWSGELFAQYHADRLQSLGLEHRERYRRLLRSPGGRLDWSWIRLLDEHFGELPERERQQLLELGLSVYYFLEDELGTEKTLCFQRARLDPARRSDQALWKDCFGRSATELQAGWRKYYGL